MAGGGAGGISSTGVGAPGGFGPGLNSGFAGSSGFGFGQGPGYGINNYGGQQQQLAPGATTPAPGSQEAYNQHMAQANYSQGNAPTYEQWSQQQGARSNLDAMSGLLRGYANQSNMAQPQVPDWMKAQLAAPEQQAATPVATTTPAATTPVATTPAAPTPVNTGDQVADLYQNLLGRKADEGGYNFWNQALQGGASIDAIRNQMMTSPEYQTNQIKGMYQNLFGREADQGGLDFWANAAKQGTSLDDIKNQLMQSTEYQTRQSQLAQAPAQPATQPVTPPPMFKTPTMSQSGGEGSGGALNFQYRRGGIMGIKPTRR